MNFRRKFENYTNEEIWNEYCGFTDLSIDEFMSIQKSLMQEQLSIWKKSAIGKSMINTDINNIHDFREKFSLTTYEDYADVLLLKKDELIPDNAVIWIKTTWEGGIHPTKLAPYTENMINTFKDNVLACMILATAKNKYEINIKPNDTFLYGLAPLPYASGLLPRAISMNFDVDFLPNVEEAEKMSFKERNKLGFKLGLDRGIDYFFGLGSVAYYISKSIESLNSKSSIKRKTKVSLKSIFRYLKGKYQSKKEKRTLLPKDLFTLKGFMITGTDNVSYKDELEEMWGIRPLEVFAGTEPTCIGCEDYKRNGLYFFPDACFYEFIRECDMLKLLDDTNYEPKTYLFNELEVGETYELVISVFKGGVFMRYRIKDVYKCIAKTSKGLPRFDYIDRTMDIIDIAGFTRISEKLVERVIELSKINIINYAIKKEFNSNNKPFLHMYIELDEKELMNEAILKSTLKDQLSIYFNYVDSDYKDLKKILGMDPLKVSVLRCKTFSKYEEVYNKEFRSFNPGSYALRDLIDLQERVN